jgi:putative transposase
MPKFARLVVPGCPHHIIQRGNRRQKVFFNDSDKELYLKLIKRHGEKAGISFLAYCLMDNHVHMIAIPDNKESFAKGIGEAHRKYTNIINIREDWKGYLWQGRFISFPLDEAHLYAAVRYVERNPIRAGLLQNAEDYRWSSARSRILKIDDVLVSSCENLLRIEDWSAYLKENDNDNFIKQVEDHEKTGRPLGGDEFIIELEKTTGRKILHRPPGRKKGNAYCVSLFQPHDETRK